MRQEPVVVETSRYRIEGRLTLPREGYRSRLSDFVNQRDRDFFAIADARVTQIDRPQQVEEMPFVLVARAHIMLLMPAAGGEGL
jgi:hypothetical protein